MNETDALSSRAAHAPRGRSLAWAASWVVLAAARLGAARLLDNIEVFPVG